MFHYPIAIRLPGQSLNLENPIVSVIICFLNPGAWLVDAVDSVINQSYQNWELILVDDGSRLSDSETALNYAEEYPAQIIYVDHEGHRNIGLTASRNKGITLARGTMIAFLDADDCWFKDKLVKQLNIFSKLPRAAMICEASRFWYSWDQPQLNDPVVYIGAPEGLYQPGELNKLLYPLGKGQPPCPTGIIIKKETLIRSGAFEEAFTGVYQLYEDQAFFAKMYINEVVYISAECNNSYRKHAGSMSGAAADPLIYGKVRNFFLNWLINYMQAKHIKDLQIEALVSAARLPGLKTGQE
jgi:glycosyltransferase involved in cell wall biosynthesis